MKLKLPMALITLLLGIGTIASGCSSTQPTSSSVESKTNTSTNETLDITVSIEPQKYFVEKIGGKNVSVNVMVPAGTEPHAYEPKPQQLRKISEAEAYIIIGSDTFEDAWMNRIKSANSSLLIVDSGKGIERIKMVAHHHHHEEEEEKATKESEEQGLDPHIWLAPSLVKKQAQNIYQGLVQLDPDREEEYKQNLDSFLAEIDRTDREIRKNLAGVTNRKFIVFHPAWGYFSREYNLEQIPIEVEGTEPSAAELKELIEEAKEEKIQVIFVEPQFSTKSAQTIAQEIKARVVPINPLAADWSDNLLKVSETFAKELSELDSSKVKVLIVLSFPHI